MDGFTHRVNNSRASVVFPSDMICVDEIISCWYGQGGHWINLGIPMHFAIDRNPENGPEI